MFTLLDGKTTSATGFKGPIGNELDKAINLLPVVKFKPVKTKLVPPPLDVVKDLSSDQSSLLYHIQWISSGVGDEKKSRGQLGKLCHSRWLTLGTRLLAYYARTENPSMELRILVTLVQECYGPFWFAYKSANTFIKAPVILHELIVALKNMELPQEAGEELKKKVINSALEPVKRNAFCLLGENFLTCMAFSSDSTIRNKGLDKIIELKMSTVKPALRGIRHAEPNLESDCWSDLIDLQNLTPANTSVPPCLETKTIEELEAMREDPGLPPSWPIHSQSVERAVRMTSEAAKHSFNWLKRHEFILAKQKSRKERPTFASKQDYV